MKERFVTSMGWLIAATLASGCPGSGTNGGGNGGDPQEEERACVLLSPDLPGEREDVERWPDGCFVPFDGETMAFNLDQSGFTGLSFEDGLLTTWDADDCGYCSPDGQPTDASTEGMRCVQHYNCGIDGYCAVRLYIDEDANRWRFDFDGWGCTAPLGTYDLFPTGEGECNGVCAPSRECGDDGCGTSCGGCDAGRFCDSGRCRLIRNEACDTCLGTCSGLPSCCTGCGCLCQSECGGWC